MKVLVCGGREFTDKNWLYEVLDRYKELYEITHIIHGGARGADELSGYYARERGIQEVLCPANWDRHGKAAGILRNLSMAELLSECDIVIAFPGGRGTEHMVKTALNKGLTVLEESKSTQTPAVSK